jgi:hypothetical protein
MPTRRQVGELDDRRVLRHDLVERDDAGVVLRRIVQPEELPPVIVLIVSDVQDRGAAEDDRAQGHGRGVSWLVEWPIMFRHGEDRFSGVA